MHQFYRQNKKGTETNLSKAILQTEDCSNDAPITKQLIIRTLVQLCRNVHSGDYCKYQRKISGQSAEE